MKVNSISGFTAYVKDLDKTVAFYESLGFRAGSRKDDSYVCYVNWFSITFKAQAGEDKSEFQTEATTQPRGAGLFINVKVDDVDEFYNGVLALGLKPSSEPRDWPWGNREFVLRDPDGYKLVFFQKN